MKRTYTAEDLIGTWQTPDPDNGYKATITITFCIDQVLHYVFENRYGKTELKNKWEYQKNVLTEYSSHGKLTGSLQWLTDNYFVLTIIDNGDISYRGIKRYYERLPEPKK